jgi:hypothetical protein
VFVPLCDYTHTRYICMNNIMHVVVVHISSAIVYNPYDGRGSLRASSSLSFFDDGFSPFVCVHARQPHQDDPPSPWELIFDGEQLRQFEFFSRASPNSADEKKFKKVSSRTIESDYLDDIFSSALSFDSVSALLLI